MKKIILGLVVLVVVIFIAIYFYPKSEPIQTTTQNSTSTASEASSTNVIHDLINVAGFTDRPSFPIVNTTTKDAISIQDSGLGGQNPDYYIYVNQKKVGEIGGYQSMPSFSPDNNHFAILDAYDEGCAGNCFGFNIPVINLLNDTMITLEPQPAPHDEYIESYSWDGDNAIDVTSYEITYSGGSLTTNPDYYRVSPKEVWRYDLTTGSSTLISSTP
jgi:hypothetical protein